MASKKGSRTFGWVQNPGKFENLKRTVQIFDMSSEVYAEVKDFKIPSLVKDEVVRDQLIKAMEQEEIKYSYKELVGSGISIRRLAPCDAIVQATITDQGNKKGYIDNWSSDGFVRWAHALGFIEYERGTDSFYLTETGLAYSRAEDESEEEQQIIIEALSSYPPAIRILTLLENGEHLTKFELGKKLGFSGENGFTSLPQDIMLDTLANSLPKEKNSIRTDWEGSSDKYARMIGGWLAKMGLVRQERKEFDVPKLGDEENREFISHAFIITGAGLAVLRRAKGASKLARVPKRVYWEMLATKINGKVYVRTRRAYILDMLMKTSSLTVQQILSKLEELGFSEIKETVENDLQGLMGLGLFIETNGRTYQLRDTIQPFEIPSYGITEELVKGELEEKKSELRQKLKYVPHEYIELVEIARDSKQDRLFEMKVIEFFVHIYEFRGKHLGGSRKPDGALYTNKLTNNYGIIVDTKAYSKGYNLPISQADEMQRYVDENRDRDAAINPNEWWLVFPRELSAFKFLFVSSYFKGKFEDQLNRLNMVTGCAGAVLSVEQLLIGGEKIQEGLLSLEEVGEKFNNEEIFF